MLGALVILFSLALAVWVAVGVYELVTDRDQKPAAPEPKPDPVVWPARPEWVAAGGRHRKADAA